MRTLAIATTVLAMLAGPLSAQQRAIRGDRVRVWIGSGVTVTGTLEAIDADSLSVRLVLGVGRYSRSEVQGLAVSGGTGTRVLQGAWTGALAGASAGLDVTELATCLGKCGPTITETMTAVTIGGLLGVSAGAAIGAFLHREVWETVTLGPGTDGHQAIVEIRFRLPAST